LLFGGLTVLTTHEINQARYRLDEQLSRVQCLREAVERGDRTYTAAVIEATCNAAASAMTAMVNEIDAIKSGCRAKVSATDPRNLPRLPSRPIADSRPPAVSSVGSL
jgi:hypothetical protein